jgi:hypothetical protein
MSFWRKPKYLADCEYWVYLGKKEQPDSDELMSLSMSGAAIGPPEGILFSDIRLHIAMALRSQNPHIFRPDLDEEDVIPSKELLEALAESPALLKVRYISEDKLTDGRHLKLLPYIVLAAFRLGDGLAVLDRQTLRLMAREEFEQQFKVEPDPLKSSMHVRAVWKPNPAGGRVESRGLVKMGLRDFATREMNFDERWLVMNLAEEAAQRILAAGEYPEELEVESFDDKFHFVFNQRVKGLVQATLLRRQ